MSEVPTFSAALAIPSASGAFLEPEEEGKERTLYLILMWFKGDRQDDLTEDEVADAVAKLREALTQGDLVDETDLSDPISN